MEFHFRCMDCARFNRSCTDMIGIEPAGSCFVKPECKVENVGLTHRGEVIMMLRELYKALPKNEEVRGLLEQNKITHLIDVCPSSVEFILREAIKELGGVL